MGLKKQRAALASKLQEGGGKAFDEFVRDHWTDAELLIKNWRNALKEWEGKETFERAYQANRMSVRSFAAEFKGQVRKKIDDLKIVGTNRVRPDSTFQGTFPRDDHAKHLAAFNDASDRRQRYHAQRGLDSSDFAVPANFVTREKKYELGLHDLSASLISKDLPFFEQVHNKEDGALFAFLPLPETEDQALLFTLIRAAKAMKQEAPQFYATVRALRGEITRVKLAAEFDMAIGYSIVPIAGAQVGQLPYKLRYTLAHTTHPVQGETSDAKATVGDKHPTLKKVDKETYEARQQAGLNYKSILEKAARRTEGHKNEIILAVRKHEGAFPVYAIRRGDVLKTIDTSSGTPAEGAEIPMKYA